MPVIPATLLRLAHRDPLPVAPTPRVVGVDDFSLRKGQIFGTILVDLERRQPIDLLPDRTAVSLATWLEQHPGVAIIGHDRATEYANGATRGVPAAVQVADRFHLRFLRADQFPEQGQRRTQRSKRDPFVPYLRDQRAAGNANGAALWRVLRDQHGYTGGRSQVTQWIADHRQRCVPSVGTARRERLRTTQPPPPTPRRRSARQVSWLFIRPFERLDAEEQQVVKQLT